MPNRTRKPSPLTNKQRGLGWQHTQNRERLLRRHINGRLCWWCGKPMYREPERNFDGHPLEADHSRSRSQHGTTGNNADRLLHKTCNIQRGDGTRDEERPTVVQQAADAPMTDLGPLAMGWPESFR
ncbi:hypothetical protein [Mycolicibacterium mengxianglii]|uniref:hypothetical protein n=1 Tax=Mycolicibacterium mengxianglii TaxID=2736649 RepID=UPI0018D13E73|nr:hypothetical protein [Mycolicibacterium mengxianglii]